MLRCGSPLNSFIYSIYYIASFFSKTSPAFESKTRTGSLKLVNMAMHPVIKPEVA